MSGDFQSVILGLVDDIDLDAPKGEQDAAKPPKNMLRARTLFAVPRNICCADTPEFPTVSNCKGVARDRWVASSNTSVGAARANLAAVAAIAKTKRDMGDSGGKLWLRCRRAMSLKFYGQMQAGLANNGNRRKSPNSDSGGTVGDPSPQDHQQLSYLSCTSRG